MNCPQCHNTLPDTATPVKFCPYCGAAISTTPQAPKTNAPEEITDLFPYLMETKGISFCQEEVKVLSVFADLLPQAKKLDRNRLKSAYQSGAYRLLFQAVNQPVADQQIACKKACQLLVDDYGLSETSATETVCWLSNTLFPQEVTATPAPPKPTTPPTPKPVTPEVRLKSNAPTPLNFKNNITAGCYGTVAIKAGGTVLSTFDRYHVQDWSHMISIAQGFFFVIGIDENGRMHSCGDNDYEQGQVRHWDNIAHFCAGQYHAVGVHADGTVIATGKNEEGQCNVQSWRDIIEVSASRHTVGLRANGTVVATGKNNFQECDVQSWKNIIAVSAGLFYTVGLRANGTVVSTRSWDKNVSKWSNIIAISAGNNHVVGLRSDGTVVASGSNNHGECDVQNWKNIVAVAVGDYHTVGLRADGSIVATGSNDYGRCEAKNWTNIAL